MDVWKQTGLISTFVLDGREGSREHHCAAAATNKKKRRKRTIFTCEQLSRLESEFEEQQYMVGTERHQLAEALNLTETQVSFVLRPVSVTQKSPKFGAKCKCKDILALLFPENRKFLYKAEFLEISLKFPNIISEQKLNGRTKSAFLSIPILPIIAILFQTKCT